MAKKYRTLLNSCTEKVDIAWEQLEDEFGEDVPVRVSYVVGKKEFQKLDKEDMLNTIKEFAELYRTNSARCTETCELTYFLYFICKIIYTELQIFLDIDVGYRRCPESVFMFQPSLSRIGFVYQPILDIDVRYRRCPYSISTPIAEIWDSDVRYRRCP